VDGWRGRRGTTETENVVEAGHKESAGVANVDEIRLGLVLAMVFGWV
jgi:hypothetical protein